MEFSRSGMASAHNQPPPLAHWASPSPSVWNATPWKAGECRRQDFPSCERSPHRGWGRARPRSFPPSPPRSDRARRLLPPARRRSRCHGDGRSGPGPTEAPGAAVEASARGPSPCPGMRRGRGRWQPLLRGEGEGWEVVQCGRALRGSHQSGCPGSRSPGTAPGASLSVCPGSDFMPCFCFFFFIQCFLELGRKACRAYPLQVL